MESLKRITATLCSLLMACALLPAAAFADGETPLMAAQAPSASWVRLAGADALGTMYEIVDEAFAKDSCDTVVIATSEGYWDALTAAGIAGVRQCPILITKPYALSAETRYQIARVGASHAIIAGGEAAISYTVESTLKNEMGLTVERAAGDNAALTAIEIYGRGTAEKAWSETAIVATAGGYWDAMSASPYAYHAHAPIFLAQADAGDGSTQLDATTLNAIQGGGFTRVLICGGTAAVSGNVEGQLAGLSVSRLQGATAIETSQAIAGFCVREGMQANGMAVATVDGYWDGLVGAPLCGLNEAPLILARPDQPTTASSGFVASQEGAISTGYILGGTAALPDSVKSALEQATR